VEQEKEKVLKAVLRRLNSTSNNIEASAVMTRDGLTLASVFDENVCPDRLGAMCASMLSLAAKTAQELARGNLEQVLIEGENGYLLIVHIGQNAVLSVISRPSSNLGMVFIEAKKTAAELLKAM
jgi:predicted regulator of Ras-like GTPase activity (Roadblock/LC7/MglB family)